MKFLFVEINRRACRFFVFRVGKVVHADVGYPGRANFFQEDLQPVDITKPKMLLDVVDAVEHHAQAFGQILLQEAANDIDESYLIYKVLNQHSKVIGGRGNPMPLGKSLSDAQKCLLINWIESGAK